MKFIKKLLLLNIFVLLSVFFIKPAPAQTADAVIDSTAFSYVTISKYGQKLSLDNFKTVDNTSYIITNDNLTISIKPLDYEYNINLDEYSDEYIVSTKRYT